MVSHGTAHNDQKHKTNGKGQQTLSILPRPGDQDTFWTPDMGPVAMVQFVRGGQLAPCPLPPGDLPKGGLSLNSLIPNSWTPPYDRSQ